jgi:D-inositol-3-phosphate glycosyltransferase
MRRTRGAMDFEDLRHNWEEFGRRSPISAIDTQLPTDDWGEFFASGERVVGHLMSRLESQGIRPGGTAALDFGCGAGRLTQALARRFEAAVGVDLASSMIALAERFNPFPERCRFVLNQATDLACLGDASFDFVCSLLVLQHVGPALAEGYIREFVRVLRPGGLAVFQLPSELLAARPLADLAGDGQPYRAGIRRVRSGPAAGVGSGVPDGELPVVVMAGRPLIVDVVVTNLSSVAWTPRDQVRLGKRWLSADAERVLEPEDDGTRVLLPGTIEPGSEVQVTLQVAVPSPPGDYLLEADVVQEGVAWFRHHGSPTLRLPVTVAPREGDSRGGSDTAGDVGETLPRMEMHGLPRARVPVIVGQAGGAVLAALEDHSAGAEWESFLYVVERPSRPGQRHAHGSQLSARDSDVDRDAGSDDGVRSGSPGPAVGSVDTPRDGDAVAADEMVVRGWHAFGGCGPFAVLVTALGDCAEAGAMRHAWATVGQDRPDVAKAYNDAAMTSTGWSALLDLTDWPCGDLRLDLIVWPSARASPVLWDPIELSVGEPTVRPAQVSIDSPSAGTVLDRGVTSIVGWAFDPGGPIDRVEIEIGDMTPVRARIGLPRPDVLSAQKTAHALLAGFEAFVDLRGLPATTHTVTVNLVAHALDPRATAVTSSVFHLAGAPSHADEEMDGAHPAPADVHVDERPREFSLLAFTHDLDYGGAQLWLTELLDRCGAGRVFPCTVVSARSGPLCSMLRDLGVSVHVTSSLPVDDFEAHEGRLEELAQLAATGSHPVALVNTLAMSAGAELATRLRIPFVWAIHESYSLDQWWPAYYGVVPVHPLVRASTERALRAADAVIFAAESTRQLLLPWTTPGNDAVVPYGVDTAAIGRYMEGTDRQEARRMLGLPAEATVLLNVATTEPRKSQTVLAEAFALIADDFASTYCVFVGARENPYADALRSYLAGSGLGDRSRVVPVVENTYPWYRAADLLVSTSDIESLPRTALEAMCFEDTVVATSVYGMPELIEDGVTGLLFEARSVAATEAALRRALRLPTAELHAIAAAGAAVVRARYDSAGYATHILGLLKHLHANRPRLPAE